MKSERHVDHVAHRGVGDPSGPRGGRESQRQRQSSFQSSETARPDEVIPVDGVAPRRKLETWSQRPPRATRGGSASGAGSPAVRPQHVVRVEESQLGESCWKTHRPRE